ncbi:MAG: hypothetical protein KGM47_15525, partial [Acidobacteriota bacterium]|nr:hypothetical protein [Acidobacteriota bacterium]
MRSPGIVGCDLTRVSSIFPLRSKLIPLAEGVKELNLGQMTLAVVSVNFNREPPQLPKELSSFVAFFQGSRKPHSLKTEPAPQLVRGF